MNTVNKFVSEISRKLADTIVEATNYKVLYEESQNQFKEAQEQLLKVNKVLQSDEKLKELFDETAEKLEKE